MGNNAHTNRNNSGLVYYGYGNDNIISDNHIQANNATPMILGYNSTLYSYYNKVEGNSILMSEGITNPLLSP